MDKTSRIPGFHKLSRLERMDKIGLSDAQKKAVEEGLSLEQAEHMIENVIGFVKTPLGIATNFIVNGRDCLVPMATEEPSVVAAASNAAKIARELGGFKANASRPVMRGLIQLMDVDPKKAGDIIAERKSEIIELANRQDKILVERGGGATDVTTRALSTGRGPMLLVYLMVDVRDAMGANAVNTMCEAVSKYLAGETGGRPCLRIISNYATERLVSASAIFGRDELGGPRAVESILDACELAASDVYRAATHNKGIMNGIDAVTAATGNDFRAVEAGAHAYASRSGRYMPLTSYRKDKDGNLIGELELPLAVGIVGGATRTNPAAQAALSIMGVKTANELSEIIASVGLAQNLAALKALATEGIQKGHMRLHAQNIAITAGASGGEAERIAAQMVEEGKITVERARQLLGK
ncbi:MAG: hydroxymethylglutaryl-CoA reductase, degradative [Candidatus Altiarchaeota archaeon]|nr:hydroxymethylglutaryl-CoA reductase, degradative [Candidatus Altiarchaeota archaeon]